MIDEHGVSDACYHELVDAVEVGIAAKFGPEAEIVGLDETMLRRNPQLLQRRDGRDIRIYHPAQAVVQGNVRVVSFLRWFDWQDAQQLQLVLRWEKAGPYATCARFGENRTFGFDRLQDEHRERQSRHRYTNLDFYSITPKFNPVYIRSGSVPEDFRYFRVEGDIMPDGNPSVVTSEVDHRVVPKVLCRAQEGAN